MLLLHASTAAAAVAAAVASTLAAAAAFSVPMPNPPKRPRCKGDGDGGKSFKCQLKCVFHSLSFSIVFQNCQECVFPFYFFLHGNDDWFFQQCAKKEKSVPPICALHHYWLSGEGEKSFSGKKVIEAKKSGSSVALVARRE